MVYTKNLLCWLEKVLLERFGVTFTLRLHEDRWVLTVRGLDGCIEVLRAHTSFDGPARTIPCTQWCANGSGLQPAIAGALPAPGSTTLPNPLLTELAGGFRIGYDIFGLAAWMMTRQEEIGAVVLDAHGRFPAVESHAYRHGYLDRPVVDEWLLVLQGLIQRVWPTLTIKQHVFTQIVSHDVDEPSFAAFASPLMLLRRMVGDAMRRGRLSSLVDMPRIRRESRSQISKREPFNTFEWLMDQSERRGLKSAFYFICGRTVPARDALYELEHPAIRHLLRRIHSRGHEIGLHPSYGTYQSPALIAQEAARLKRVCGEEGIEQQTWGGRMHYLRWAHPTTMYGWEAAGMTYDSTLGYGDQPGFRCGTCFDYPAFDPVRNEMLNLRIRPLVAMDQTFLGKHYLDLGTGDRALSRFVQLKDACRRVNGAFTLLWHNSFFPTVAERNLYERVLDA